MQLLLKHTANPIARNLMLKTAIVSAIEQQHAKGIPLVLELIPSQQEREQILGTVLSLLAENNREIEMRFLFDTVGNEEKVSMMSEAISQMVENRNASGIASVLKLPNDNFFENTALYQLLKPVCEKAVNTGNDKGLTMLLNHFNDDRDTLKMLVSFCFEIAAQVGKINIMTSLLLMTTEPQAKDALVKIGFKHTAGHSQAGALDWLLQPLSPEAKDALIHADNNNAFKEAALNQRVGVMKVLAQHSSPARKVEMLNQHKSDIQQSALQKDHADVLRFLLEEINPNPTNRRLSGSEKKSSSAYLLTQETANLIIKINELFPLAVARGSKKTLELLFELIEDKSHLEALCKEELTSEKKKSLSADMQALLNPTKAWKTGKRMRELKDLGIGADKVGAMTELAMEAISTIKQHGVEGLQSLHASTILSSQEVTMVCNILRPADSLLDKLATIRHSKKLQTPKPAIDDITTAEGKLTFLEKLVEQANKAANQNSLQGSGIV